MHVVKTAAVLGFKELKLSASPAALVRRGQEGGGTSVAGLREGRGEGNSGAGGFYESFGRAGRREREDALMQPRRKKRSIQWLREACKYFRRGPWRQPEPVGPSPSLCRSVDPPSPKPGD